MNVPKEKEPIETDVYIINAGSNTTTETVLHVDRKNRINCDGSKDSTNDINDINGSPSCIVDVDDTMSNHGSSHYNGNLTPFSTALIQNSWNCSMNKSMVLKELQRTKMVSYKVDNWKKQTYFQPTNHIHAPRSTFVRHSLPDFESDNETILAFLICIFGTVCHPILFFNFYYYNSANKRARKIARWSICLSVPFFLLLSTTVLSVINSMSNDIDIIERETMNDMTEKTVHIKTCRSSNTGSDRALCCAAEGSLIRYVDMCADAGVVDPTGRLCRYQLAPCMWSNKTVGNTTTVHCHGVQSDPKTICHKHRATHITGKEPGEL